MGLGAWSGVIGAAALMAAEPSATAYGPSEDEPLPAAGSDSGSSDGAPLAREEGPSPAVARDGASDGEEPSEPAPITRPRFREPQRIRGRDRRPVERTPSRFTDRPPLVRPALRLAPGFSARLSGRPHAAFGLDVLASVMVGLHGGYRQWGLAPELGYSLRAPGVDHQLLAGVGLLNGINAEGMTLGWLPRVVMQPRSGEAWLGVRNGLWLDFAENGFSVELSHQWLRAGSNDVHELRLTLGVDLAMLAFVLSDARMAWL